MLTQPSQGKPNACLLPKPPSPVVVFDSGVGGLSVLQELLKRRPDLRYIYLADTEWMPYGLKASEVISKRLERLHALAEESFNAKLWLMACNTASSALPLLLKPEDNPQGYIYGEHWLDLLRPTVEKTLGEAALLQKPKVNVALMATASTVKSGRYPAMLQEYSKQLAAYPMELHCFACPGLAEAVEGKPGSTVEELLARLMPAIVDSQPDILILACTHYLHIEPAIAAYLPPQVRILNPAQAIVEASLPFLPKPAAIVRKQFPPSWLRYVVTSQPEAFYTQMCSLPRLQLPMHLPELLLV
jgi:glutamate racemase